MRHCLFIHHGVFGDKCVSSMQIRGNHTNLVVTKTITRLKVLFNALFEINFTWHKPVTSLRSTNSRSARLWSQQIILCPLIHISSLLDSPAKLLNFERKECKNQCCSGHLLYIVYV